MAVEVTLEAQGQQTSSKIISISSVNTYFVEQLLSTLSTFLTKIESHVLRFITLLYRIKVSLFLQFLLSGSRKLCKQVFQIIAELFIS